MSALLISGVACMSGCVDAPTTGLLTFNNGPVSSSGKVGGGKIGEASAYQVLGLIAWGDASIEAAARKGGLSHVNTADRETTNILGIFSSYTTKVVGD